MAAYDLGDRTNVPRESGDEAAYLRRRMLSEQPGNRFEIELPADWPPCPRCASRTRVAVATLSRRNVGFYCGGADMHKLRWTTGHGSTADWIDQDIFWPGGDFEGLIPTHFLGLPKNTATNRRCDIDERRKDWIHNEQTACALCGVAPMRDWYDGGKLLDWLRSRNAPEFWELMAIVNATQPRLQRSTWYAYLVNHHIELVARINFLIEDSHLQAGHSIPENVLAALSTAWSPQMQRVGRNTLAFGFCRPCNAEKHAGWPSRDELLRRHVALNHGGSKDAAKADVVTWLPLLRVLQSLEEYRATLSVLDAGPEYSIHKEHHQLLGSATHSE